LKIEAVGKSGQITFAYRPNFYNFSFWRFESGRKRNLVPRFQLMPTVPGVHEEEVHLHEGEDHVEDGVDAREQVPGAALLRNLEEVDEL
jgi:hypothetical protein